MKKFLTIGSMCDLVGDENNTKYLIIGYKKKRKDYEAVLFPGGTTGKDPVYKYFNADEVDEIYDLGYKDQVAIDYVNDLFSKKESDIDFYDESSLTTNQENQVLETSVSSEIDNSENRNYDLLNKIKFDENGVVISDDSVPSFNQDNSKFMFDENGVVISDGTEDVNKSNGYKFDENGVVISDETEDVNKSNGYKFDENGVVISDGTENTDNSSVRYKFDENGTVISDGTEVSSTISSNFKFDENGVVISDGTEDVNKSNGYKFDENGVVIAE